MDSISALRNEFPALALTIGFAARKDRAYLADMLLLWLEYRRATRSSENLVAAARLAWWREAFQSSNAGHVPLAERIITWSGQRLDISRLVNQTDRLVGAVLDGDSIVFIHAEFAALIAIGLERDGEAKTIASVLSCLAEVMEGSQAGLPLEKPGYTPLALIAWLCEEPSRLDYPEKHPMLALRMLLQACRR